MSSLAIINASDRLDGITRSIEPYYAGLPRLGYSVTWYQCVDYHGEPGGPEGGVTVPGFGFPNRTVDMGINRWWVFPRRLRLLRADTILLADPTLVRVAPDHSRVIVNVHDLRPLTPFSDRSLTRLMFRRVVPRLRKVWRILVPSVAVKEQLDALDVPADIVRVVPETHRLGLHPDHVDRSLRRIRDQRATRVLCISTDRPYKNIDFFLRLARAMRDRREHRYSFTLVSRLRPQTRRSVERLGLGNLQVLPSVDDIAGVYDAHDVLVFPSRFEGFGRPLIEAMAFGLPILANPIPPVIDVVRDAGLLLEVGSIDSWVQGLLSLEDPTEFASLAGRSLERGKSYLPDRFAEFLRQALTPS